MAEGALVRFENVGGIGVITVDNPPVNALSPGVPEGIVENVERGNADPAIKAMVLIGAGIEHLVRALSRNRRRPSRAEMADVGARNKAPAGADQHHCLYRGIGIAALDILDDAFRHAW